MSLEKHNALYAMQYVLHEYDETGAVSRRTMEMLGARAILLRYEIEGELADAMAKERAKKARQVVPDKCPKKADDTTNVVPLKKRPVGRPRKNCAECGTELTGKQRKFCSKRCGKAHWIKNNKESVKKHNRDWYERQKALGRV